VKKPSQKAFKVARAIYKERRNDWTIYVALSNDEMVIRAMAEIVDQQLGDSEKRVNELMESAKAAAVLLKKQARYLEKLTGCKPPIPLELLDRLTAAIRNISGSASRIAQKTPVQ